MAISYVGKNKMKKVLEPLLNRSRAKYRGPRDSALHNAEAAAIYMDISRISALLEDLNLDILGKSELLTGTTSVYNNYSLDELRTLLLNDGANNALDTLRVYIDEDTKDYSDSNDQDDVYIGTTLRNQGRVLRLISRISTLEEES